MIEQQILKRETLGFVDKSRAETECTGTSWEEMICIFL